MKKNRRHLFHYYEQVVQQLRTEYQNWIALFRVLLYCLKRVNDSFISLIKVRKNGIIVAVPCPWLEDIQFI